MNSIRTYIRQVLSEAGGAEQPVNLERQVGDTLSVLEGTYTGTDPTVLAFYNATAGFLSSNLGAINEDVNKAYTYSPPIGAFRTRDDDKQLALCLEYLLNLDADSAADYPYRTALYMIGVNRGMVSPGDLVVQLVTDTDEMIKKGEDLASSWGFTLRGSTEATLPQGVTPAAVSSGLFSYVTPASVGATGILALVAFKTGPALKLIANAVAEKLLVAGGRRVAAAAAGTSTFTDIVDAVIRKIVSDDATWLEIIKYLKNKSALPSGLSGGLSAGWTKFATAIDVARLSRAQTQITNIITPVGRTQALAGPGVTAPQDIVDAIFAMIRASLQDSATRLTRESFDAAADAGFESLSISARDKAVLKALVNNSTLSWSAGDAAKLKAVRDALWDCLDVFRQAARNKTFTGTLVTRGKILLAGALLVSAGSIIVAAAAVGSGALVASLTDALVNDDEILAADAAKNLVTDVRLRTAAIEAHEALSGESFQIPVDRVLMGNPLAALGQMLNADYTAPADSTTMRVLATQFGDAARNR